MPFFLRKITRPKWEPNGELSENVNSLQADVVSECLKTKGNTLSVWFTETNDWNGDQVKKILGALFSTMPGPDRADVLFIDEEKVKEKGIGVEDTQGKSPALDDINDLHKDFSELNWALMQDVADLILNELKDVKIKEDQNKALKHKGVAQTVYVQAKRYSEKNVKNLVKEQLALGNIIPDKLHERWKKHLGLDA